MKNGLVPVEFLYFSNHLMSLLVALVPRGRHTRFCCVEVLCDPTTTDAHQQSNSSSTSKTTIGVDRLRCDWYNRYDSSTGALVCCYPRSLVLHLSAVTYFNPSTGRMFFFFKVCSVTASSSSLLHATLICYFAGNKYMAASCPATDRPCRAFCVG